LRLQSAAELPELMRTGLCCNKLRGDARVRVPRPGAPDQLVAHMNLSFAALYGLVETPSLELDLSLKVDTDPHTVV
jgi:hypothetical protein